LSSARLTAPCSARAGCTRRGWTAGCRTRLTWATGLAERSGPGPGLRAGGGGRGPALGNGGARPRPGRQQCAVSQRGQSQDPAAPWFHVPRNTTGSGRSVAYRALVRLDRAEAAGPAATTRLSSGAACHIQLEAQLFFTLWPPRIGRTHLHPRRRPRGPVRHTTMIPLPGCPQSRTQNGTLLDSGCFACSWSANWRSSVAVLEPDDVVQFRG